MCWLVWHFLFGLTRRSTGGTLTHQNNPFKSHPHTPWSAGIQRAALRPDRPHRGAAAAADHPRGQRQGRRGGVGATRGGSQGHVASPRAAPPGEPQPQDRVHGGEPGLEPLPRGAAGVLGWDVCMCMYVALDVDRGRWPAATPTNASTPNPPNSHSRSASASAPPTPAGTTWRGSRGSA